MLEDKGATLALHYRLAPRLASHVHRTLRAHMTIALAAESGWRLQPGKGILEIKPDGRDKGTAILEYMTRAAVCGRACRYSSATISPTSTASLLSRPRADGR